MEMVLCYIIIQGGQTKLSEPLITLRNLQRYSDFPSEVVRIWPYKDMEIENSQEMFREDFIRSSFCNAVWRILASWLAKMVQKSNTAAERCAQLMSIV